MLHTLVHREGGMRENNIVRLRPARSLSFSVLCLYSIIVVRSVYDLSIIISCFIFSFHPFFPQIYTHTSYFRPLPPTRTRTDEWRRLAASPPPASALVSHSNFVHVHLPLFLFPVGYPFPPHRPIPLTLSLIPPSSPASPHRLCLLLPPPLHGRRASAAPSSCPPPSASRTVHRPRRQMGRYCRSLQSLVGATSASRGT